MENGRYVTINLPEQEHSELVAECKRLEVSRTWILRAAWEIAKGEIFEMPAPCPLCNDAGCEEC